MCYLVVLCLFVRRVVAPDALCGGFHRFDDQETKRVERFWGFGERRDCFDDQERDLDFGFRGGFKLKTILN